MIDQLSQHNLIANVFKNTHFFVSLACILCIFFYAIKMTSHTVRVSVIVPGRVSHCLGAYCEMTHKARTDLKQ